MISLDISILIVIIFINCFINIILKKLYKTYINPLSIFLSIWIIILFLGNILEKVSIRNNVIIICIIIAYIIPCIIFIKKYKNINFYIKPNVSDKNIEKLIIITTTFRVFQLIFDAYIIYKIGGNICDLFNDSQWLRFVYLAREETTLTIIIGNLLNYFSEFALILSAIYFMKNNIIKYLSINIILALFNSIFTMSKLAFAIDILLVLGVFLIFYNRKKILKYSYKDNKKRNSKKYIVIIIIFILFIYLLKIVATQRGYDNQVSKIEGITNVTLYKGILYFIGPFMAFNKLLSMDIKYNLGMMTFTPFLKNFMHFINNIDMIDIGIGEVNVYTIFGRFYLDFGVLGCIVLTMAFSFVFNIIYYKSIINPSITRIATLCILNTFIFMSFFDWIGQQTFFWLFPIFVLILTKFLKKINFI